MRCRARGAADMDVDVLRFGMWFLFSGSLQKGLGFRVWDFGVLVFRAFFSGFRVQGLGFRV